MTPRYGSQYRGVVALVAVSVLATGGAALSVVSSRSDLRIAPIAVAEPPAVRPLVPEPMTVVAKPAPPVAPRKAPVASRKAPRVAGPRCPAAPAMPAFQATAAHGAGPSVHVFDAPGGRVVRELKNPWDGSILTLLVVERRGDWLRVMMPIRPNGVTGWVREGEVSLFTVPTRILIEVCQRRLTVFNKGVPVFQARVAVGAARTPTPLGRYYVNYEYQPGGGNCCGPWILGLSAFSEVLQEFAGGVGQTAIHGWRNPSAMGKAVSHGCIRMTTGDVTRVAGLTQPGTPVTISA